MIDYNNSENASSLIGMLKQGGGLVNIEDEQTITGVKTFLKKISIRDIADVGGRNIDIFSKRYALGTGNGRFRIGEFSSYSPFILLSLSTNWGGRINVNCLLTITEVGSAELANRDVSFNVLGLSTYESMTGQTLKKVIFSTDFTTNPPNKRYLSLEFDYLGDYDNSMQVFAVNLSNTSTLSFYDKLQTDSSIAGYTDYKFDVVTQQVSKGFNES